MPVRIPVLILMVKLILILMACCPRNTGVVVPELAGYRSMMVGQAGVCQAVICVVDGWAAGGRMVS